MNRLLTAALVCLSGCDAVVGELGEAEQPPAAPPRGAPLITKLDCLPLTGDAPLNVTCALTVTHPEGKPVSCSVDPGTGAAPTTVGDCLTPQSLPFVFATPGQYRLKVMAADPDLNASNQVVMITANLRPNQAPVIDAFAASPSTGGAPFTPTLTWSVADPEGDALTCKLNDTPVDCASGSFPWPVMTPGTVTVTLTVTDALGLSTTKTVTLTAVMPVGDVRIAKVEWAQSVVLTDLKLVAGKEALLRVHVLGDKANLQGCTVEATGKVGTPPVDLGKLTLVGPASPPTAEVPGDLTKQYTVTVPASWVEQGLEVALKIDAADALPETDEANNVQTLRPVVGRGTLMQLTNVPVMHQGQVGTITPLEPSLTRVWPLKGTAAQTRAPYTFPGTLTGGATQAWADLLDDIAQVRQMDGSSRNYYGFVKVQYQSGVAGIGYIGQDAAVGRDDSIETAQHELGHNMGRNHAPCGGVAGADAQYPYAGAKIGSWGYDAVTKRLMNPATYVDLMSYCQPEWISDYNYKAVQRFLEAQPYVPPGTPSPFVTAIAVSGRFSDDGVLLRPPYRVRSRLPEPGESASNERALKVTFAGGAERVVALETHEIADLPGSRQSFSVLIEDLGAISKLEVFERGQRLLARSAQVSPEPARTEVTRVSANEIVVRWDAARWPTAAVAHLAGHERTTLALGLTGGQATVRVDGLGGGELEVSVSDGVDASAQSVRFSGPQ